MLIKRYALVQPLETVKTRHIVGLPPELTGGVDLRKRLPDTRVLVLEETADGSVLLNRLSASGEFAGDTWHANMDDAEHQAQDEFAEKLGPWTDLPEDASDPAAFVRETVLHLSR